MAPRPALVTQADQARIIKAAKQAGCYSAKYVAYPDGRVEISYEILRSETRRGGEPGEWDDLLE